MIALIKEVQTKIRTMLTVFADGITSVDPTLSSKIGFTANESFLLRGYLSLQRLADCDEIAISIDIWNSADQLNLEADICTDRGEVLIVGPRAVISVVSDRSALGAGVGEWLHELQRLLDEHRQTVLSAASKLV